MQTTPIVEAGLEVLGRGEGAARFEVGAQGAVAALEDALGLGVGGLARSANRRGGRRRRRRRDRWACLEE
jgi:hypothetical protein